MSGRLGSRRFALTAIAALFVFTGIGTKPAQGATPYPAGFGRFGRFHDDGLLTLNVSPQGFATPTLANGGPLQFQFGSGPPPVVTVQQINATEKTLHLSGGGVGTPDALHYTLLYPGFGAHWGKSLRLSLIDGSPTAPYMVLERLTSPASPQITCFLLRRVDKPAVPVALVFRSFRARSFRPLLSTQGKQVTLTLQDREAIGNALVVTPQGLRPLSPAPAPDELARLHQDALAWAGRAVPIRVRSEYELLGDGKTVRFTEQFKVDGEGESIAPVPPLLAFAKQHGYPVRLLNPVVTTECRTWQGDFAFVRGPIVRYELPVPPTQERGYVRAAEDKVGDTGNARIALLNDLVGHLGGDWAANAVDLGYAGMANAQMAWAYLTPAQRASVTDAWKRYLPLAFHLPPYAASDAKQPWKVETEPFTRQSYVWTYFIDGPKHLHYDLDWGDALPLYGLYKYAQYGGDWAFVRQHWADARRIYRYFDLGDDWAWMTVVNADHGYSTGTGDPMAATYAGTAACLNMARAVNDRDEEAHYACKAARIAVPVVARFWLTAWAQQNGLLNPDRIALGFHEKEGFTRVEMGKVDPWDVTNVLSGDGALPEVYADLLAFGNGALRTYENEYARFYPDWYQGDVKYPFETTYKGNSVYVTFPHIFARALLNEPDAQLWRYVEGAQTNRNNAWIGPNVIAELLSRQSPLRLTEWQPATYKDGVTAASGKRVLLLFHFARPTDWSLTADVAARAIPRRVTINGKPVPFIYKASSLAVHASVSNDVEVEVTF